MAQTKEAVRPTIPMTPTPSHRFLAPDFSICGEWLLTTLRERWPHLDERNIMGWLRGLIESPEYLFIRNAKAVLLAQRINEHLEPRPVVLEIFCCVQDGGVYDAQGLYMEMKRWAEGLGAEKMTVEQFTRLPRNMIVEAVGPIVNEKISTVYLKDTRPQ